LTTLLLEGTNNMYCLNLKSTEQLIICNIEKPGMGNNKEQVARKMYHVNHGNELPFQEGE
jgi:hypothetical protein